VRDRDLDDDARDGFRIFESHGDAFRVIMDPLIVAESALIIVLARRGRLRNGDQIQYQMLVQIFIIQMKTVFQSNFVFLIAGSGDAFITPVFGLLWRLKHPLL